MLTFVSVPATGLGECLPTNPTLVRLFTSVRQFMLLETGHLRKPFCASFKFAGIWPLSCVSSYVVLQVASCCEGLTAIYVRADKWSFSCVNSPVDIEVLRCVEPLSTTWKVTLAGSVRDVYLLDVRPQMGREGERSSTARVVTLVWPLFLLLHEGTLHML